MGKIFKWNGKFEIFSKNIHTKKIIKIDEVKNLITDYAKYVLVNVLIGFEAVSDIEIKYCAIGDDNTAVAGTDDKLYNEVFRTAYVSRSNPTSNVINTDFYVLDTDYSGAIEEIGIFCGTAATAAADSGNLLSRALWSYTKSSSEQIYIKRVDTIS